MKGQWTVVLKPQGDVTMPIEILTVCYQCVNDGTVYKFYSIDPDIEPEAVIKKRFLWWTWEVTEEVETRCCRFIVPTDQVLYAKHVMEYK